LGLAGHGVVKDVVEQPSLLCPRAEDEVVQRRRGGARPLHIEVWDRRPLSLKRRLPMQLGQRRKVLEILHQRRLKEEERVAPLGRHGCR
jgi:hypothetical protein